MDVTELGQVELSWADNGRTTEYLLVGVQLDGQRVMLGTFEQGPFDTSLEVAQWAWRTMAKRLPPSRS